MIKKRLTITLSFTNGRACEVERLIKELKLRKISQPSIFYAGLMAMKKGGE